MTLCYVTDRNGLTVSTEKRLEALLEKIEHAARAGVGWIQIREKDLSGRALAQLVGEALRRVPPSCRILVNDRLDVACALGAGGVHLGEGSLSVQDARRLLRRRSQAKDFVVGASTHSLEGAFSAEKAGADYVIFGPVYATPSKVPYGPPQGIARLAEAVASGRAPAASGNGSIARAPRSASLRLRAWWR